MPFIGNQPALSYTSFAKQDFTTSATTTYTLDNPVANANELALFINFVRQEPTTAYSASGTTLTLTSATSSSDDMYCVYLGKAVQTVNPPNASVGASQIVDASITSGKLASGVLPTNTPAFEVSLASSMTGLSAATDILVTFNTEKFDIGSCFNNTGSSTTLNGLTAPAHSFTPNVSGKYFVYGIIRTDASVSFPNDAYAKIFKNGSQSEIQQNGSSGSRYLTTIQRTVELNGTGDYIQLYGIGYNSNGLIFAGGTNGSFFGAYKIIE